MSIRKTHTNSVRLAVRAEPVEASQCTQHFDKLSANGGYPNSIETHTVVRRLIPTDAPLHRALMLEAYTLSPEAFTSSVTERQDLPLQWWAARMADDPKATELVVGAFVGEELVGAAGLVFDQRERTRHKAMLVGMMVRQAARGQGVGALLVEQVLRYARASGRVELVQLSVSEPNRSAIALYKRCGFAPFGTEPMAVKLGEGYIAKVHMWQRLAAHAS